LRALFAPFAIHLVVHLKPFHHYHQHHQLQLPLHFLAAVVTMKDE
jgi:hypothetical protein